MIWGFRYPTDSYTPITYFYLPRVATWDSLGNILVCLHHAAVRRASFVTHRETVPTGTFFHIGATSSNSEQNQPTVSGLTRSPSSSPSIMHRALGTTRYAPRRSLPGVRAIHRFLPATSELESYEDTLPNLRIGSHTRVIFQGFTGKQATENATDSIAWGTKIVGGVTPGRSDTHLGLPVFPTVRSVCWSCP